MPVTQTCELCGDTYSCRRSKAARRRFCSPQCYNENRKLETEKRMIGQRFSSLVVTARDNRDGETRWLCRCDCGQVKSVRGAHLLQESTLSCGCHRRKTGERMAQANGFNDKIPMDPGTRHGRLVVVGEDGQKYGRPAYLCRCDCGEMVTVYGQSLRNGDTQSCGCYHKDVSREQARRLFTKHGLYKDPDYIRHLRRRRYKADRDWTYQMEELLLSLQPSCVLCGATEKLELDHVQPSIKGGKLEPGNVVVLCRSCNATKHDKGLDELSAMQAAVIAGAAEGFAEAWRISP